MEPASPGNPMCSLIEILLEVPALLEAVPPAALTSLSSTCKSLRTLFCAKVNIITLPCPGDASKLFCTTWPNLLMVVCPHNCEITSKLPTQWECMMDIKVTSKHWIVTAVLIRSQQQHQMPLCDLPSWHYAVLSEFTDQHRCLAKGICLRGALVSCKVLQFLTHCSWPGLRSVEVMDSYQLGMEGTGDSWRNVTVVKILDSFRDASLLLHMGRTWPQLCVLDLSNSQLDGNAVWALTQVQWTHLKALSLNVNKLGSSGMQHLVSCSWPSLEGLELDDACVDAPALHCLAQGQWPELTHLSLKRNRIDATGMSYLLKGCWPRLYCPSLSVQGLDDKAYSLLGMTEREKISIRATPSSVSGCKQYRTRLPQFPQVRLLFWFECLVQH